MERFKITSDVAPFSAAGIPVWRMSTALGWDDIILGKAVFRQVRELEQQVRQGEAVLKDWSQGRGMNPGCSAIFHGRPGTGKTLTAMLLARSLGRDIYRVDLSGIVSKYIGETEKNLGVLFDQINGGESILFFDEADALFGKRTTVKEAQDRYANPEVSYLLQKFEVFNGLTILATNSKPNIDEAFLRRVDFIIEFPIPNEAERRQIWQRAFQEQAGSERLARLLSRFELTGGSIINAALFASFKAKSDGRSSICLSDAVLGVEREVKKGGEIFQNLLRDELAAEENS